MRLATFWEIRRLSILRKVRYMTHRVRMCCCLNLRKGSVRLFADDASTRILDVLEANGVEAVIPPKSNRTEKRDYDREKYKWRHLIENLFQKLKQFRGIATQYDKIAESYMGGIYFVASLIWLK